MKVTIQNKNQVFECADSEDVLGAALRQGITMPYGCRSGRCGNCMGTLVSGDIEYPNGQPPALSDDDIVANKALFCQAHAKTDLTIAEQLKRAAAALDEIDSGNKVVAANGRSAPSATPAPAGSLSAELLRTDGLIRYSSR